MSQIRVQGSMPGKTGEIVLQSSDGNENSIEEIEDYLTKWRNQDRDMTMFVEKENQTLVIDLPENFSLRVWSE